VKRGPEKNRNSTRGTRRMTEQGASPREERFL
jgi:hypothetical protein